jgi:hypothetical protein
VFENVAEWLQKFYFCINVVILFPKTKIAIITAIIAATKTAAAAMSFAAFIFSFLLGDAKSASCSIAELISSVAKTRPIAKVMVIHSVADILHNIPAVIADIVAIACIWAFCSFLISRYSPLNAYLKLFNRLMMENFSCFIN